MNLTVVDAVSKRIEDSPVCRLCLMERIKPLATQRLLTRSETEIYLCLTPEQVQRLIATKQITVLRIQKEDRFDPRELDRLVHDYKVTSQRRAAQ